MEQQLQETKSTGYEVEAQQKLFALLKKYERSFAAVLPKEFTAERWRWLIVNNIRKTPDLLKTTPVSFINAVMLAANLQVEIRERSAYLIPFGNECQLLLDYRAKIDLAARAGWTIQADLVRETDDFDYAAGGLGIQFLHKPNLIRKVDGRLVPVGDARGLPVLGYAFCESGDKRHIEIMSLADIERIRMRSRNPGAETTWKDRRAEKRILTLEEIWSLDYSKMQMRDSRNVPWAKDWDRMALKTLVHRSFNGLPMTPAMAASQEIDVANDKEGERMPIAPQLSELVYEIDPADDRPMMEEGSQEKLDETRARLETEAKAKLRAIGHPDDVRALTEAEMDAATRAAVEEGR